MKVAKLTIIPLRTLPLVSLLIGMLLQAQITADSSLEDARVNRLQSLEWGLFLHWSLGTFSGQEWTKGITDPAFFNPSAVDTDDWCEAAKSAGMGYILLVPKHHDGFCLWDTDTTDFKSTNSPIKTDVVASLRKSCDKYGLKLALYFSEADWTWPNMENPELKKRQLEELCTRYGEIAFFWMDTAQWDGGLDHGKTAEIVKQLQPDCFVGFNHGAPAGELQSREMGSLSALSGPTLPALSDSELQSLIEKNKQAVLDLDWETAAKQETILYNSYDGYRVAECSICINQKEGRWYWFYNEATKDNAIPAGQIADLYRKAKNNRVLLSIATGPGPDGRLRRIDHQRLAEVARLLQKPQ